MRNIKLICEYDGTRYHGFQRQADGIPTIQGTLEDRLEKLAGHKVTVIGSGRTDSGVHALGQVTNFKTTSRIPADRFAPALNSVLPPDIRIISGEEVSLEFHSRFSARSKTYKYFILNREAPSAVLRRYAYHIPRTLNMEKMIQASTYIVGRHDFSSFTGAKAVSHNFTRNVTELICSRETQDILSILIKADGFLYNMVRNITGTLLEVGRGKLEPEDILSILEARDRRLAGPTAPPHGLFLMEVEYCT